MTEQQKIDIDNAEKELKKWQETMEKYAVVKAKIAWVRYRAHITEGFTPEQAMELCKNE